MKTGIYIRCKGPRTGHYGSFDIGGETPIEEVIAWIRTKNPAYVESIIMALLGRRVEYEARVVEDGL